MQCSESVMIIRLVEGEKMSIYIYRWAEIMSELSFFARNLDRLMVIFTDW